MTSTSLVPVVTRTFGDDAIPTVNARDLHTFLGVAKKFADWIKAQVERARLVENRDFVLFSLLGEKGRPTVDYHLTLDAAKHISMMSNTDKGFEAREYFIECERRALDKTPALPAPEAGPALPAPNPLADQAAAIATQALVQLHDSTATHAAQVAELLSQQARLIALLEQRPAAAPAIPAPTKPRPVTMRMTTAAWLAQSGMRYTSSQKRQINDAVRAEYHEAGHPFECTKNGWGLFSAARIKLHAERILSTQTRLQF